MTTTDILNKLAANQVACVQCGAAKGDPCKTGCLEACHWDDELRTEKGGRMGLTIDILEDGGLTLTSDDENASNMRVADCFGTDEDLLEEEEDGFDINRITGYDGTDYWKKWMDTPADGATVIIDVSAKDSVDVLSALENEFPLEAGAALEVLKERGITS